MRDRTDPHARERALRIAHEDPPTGISPERSGGDRGRVRLRSWHGEPRTYSIAFTPLPASNGGQPPEGERNIALESSSPLLFSKQEGRNSADKSYKAAVALFLPTATLRLIFERGVTAAC
jgi:hypothetical protein